MKIRELVYDLVLENSKKEQLLNQKIQSWLSENPNLTPEKSRDIINWFTKVSDKLKLKFEYKSKDKETGEVTTYDAYRPQIYTFLKKFDGKHGEVKFEERFLTDPLKYNAKQAEFLYDEFHPIQSKGDEEEEEQNQVLDPKKREPTPDKEIASKELWYNPFTALINEEGFRVYSIDNQLKSIFYGYYLGTMYSQKKLNGFQWCTTAWSNQANAYESKRANRSFYFVIDESKDPDVEKNKEINKYYLSALQVFDPNTRNNFALTGIDNPGEPSITVDRLLQIYPKLANHLDKLIYIPYSDDESVMSNKITRINEVSGHPYEFSRQDRKSKLKFVNLPNMGLQKVESWHSMDEGLKKAYMMSISTGFGTNIFDKFSSGPILDEIKKNASERNYLTIWVKRALGDNEGIGTLYLKTLSSTYQVSARSRKKETTVLLAHYTQNIYGIYNKEMGDWIKKGGIIYNNYSKIDWDVYIDRENKKKYVVEIFSQNSNEPNERSFYRIYEGVQPEKNVTDKTKSIFLTAAKWKELSEKLQIAQKDGYGEFKGVDLEKDDDDIN